MVQSEVCECEKDSQREREKEGSVCYSRSAPFPADCSRKPLSKREARTGGSIRGTGGRCAERRSEEAESR
ncbi:hypothetical protein HHUSO_G17777 [Huso huso]|uniref:Uncharacterized protein n=1 Tax=Huso huso TaxID=61971 RepID=A0ABR0ZAK5_HUSHU